MMMTETRPPAAAPVARSVVPVARSAALVGMSAARVVMSAVPVADPTRRKQRPLLSDEIASPVRAQGDPPVVAPLAQVAPGHFVARHPVGGAY